MNLMGIDIGGTKTAVCIGNDLVCRLEEPRFDRDHQAGLEGVAAAGPPVVGDVRVAVRRLPRAVPDDGSRIGTRHRDVGVEVGGRDAQKWRPRDCGPR